RNDSSVGTLMVGKGKGSFNSQMPYESGLMVKGEIKAMEKLRLAGGQKGILFAKNNDYLQLMKITN
ncbi:MAG: hypothetical protein HUJ11_03840, partial [Arenibacter algicola]|nr:hypothetical protein [Arenibacter algicola]